MSDEQMTPHRAADAAGLELTPGTYHAYGQGPMADPPDESDYDEQTDPAPAATAGWTAGPELDAEVSWRVFGRRYIRYQYVVINGRHADIPTWLLEGESPDDPPPGSHAGMTAPHYSRFLEAAEDLVDRWDGDFALRRQNGVWVAEFFRPSQQWRAVAGTAPLAISLAALAAAAPAPEAR